jgi:hypothetical protein
MLARTPWAPPKANSKKRQQRLAREQRHLLVNAMARILRKGEPTAFRFEAFCTHGLRTGLILQGWNWALADLTAAAVVRTALDRIGAKRPRWIEGQRDFAQMGVILVDNCWNCGRPLLGNVSAKYCSDQCRGRFHGQVVRVWVREGDAYKSATRMARGLDEQHNA